MARPGRFEPPILGSVNRGGAHEFFGKNWGSTGRLSSGMATGVGFVRPECAFRCTAPERGIHSPRRVTYARPMHFTARQVAGFPATTRAEGWLRGTVCYPGADAPEWRWALGDGRWLTADGDELCWWTVA
jgi:hypothetical protein